jgi:hypothetical protein
MQAFFQRIDAADYRTQVNQLAAALNAAAAARPPVVVPPKRPVGRPKRERDVMAAAPEEQQAKRRGRGEYTDWFSSPYINDILREYRRCGFRARLTVQTLQASAPDDRYARLSHSTLIGWLDKQTQQLLPRFQAYLDSGLENVRQNGPVRAFEEHPAVEEEIQDTLLQMRQAGTAINSHVIRWVMRGIIDLRAPDTRLQSLSLGKQFACEWARTHLKWSWRKSTTAASKLPLDWEEQGILMSKRMAATMEMKKVRLSGISNGLHEDSLSRIRISFLTITLLLIPTGSSISHHQHGPDGRAFGSSKQLDL